VSVALGRESAIVKLSLTYLLLFPPLFILGYYLAPVVGLEDYIHVEMSGWSALHGATYWILIFLILHGGFRGWRVVRICIVAFVILSFAGIFVGQLRDPKQFTELGIRLMGAALMCWIFSALFWPTSMRRKQHRSQR